ncbi:hypothetical protein FDP41_008285 [Naegleria fowleri]|uniref:Uncharacterized protein n=1 Tax=Naegleria fowleri TaxID=5763 RepID=A0A6A5BGH3_NAEFO|nr:uncharacterized protein FDP41_008285 [Naegleria fowleri]KAF0973581.1 hypothetical protein FDP41_008285 [Naegleria fowleri]
MRSWRTNIEFRHYVRLLAGYPQGIDVFLLNYLYYDQTESEAWESERKFLIKYKAPIQMKDAYFLLSLILTRKKVTKYRLIRSESLSSLEEKGYIMLNIDKYDFFTVLYPPVLMSTLIHEGRVRTTFEEMFFVMPSTKRNEVNWEDAVQKYFYLLFTSISRSIDEQDGPLMLKDLFPFAKMNNRTSKLFLKSIPKIVYECQSAKPIQGKISTVAKQQSNFAVSLRI